MSRVVLYSREFGFFINPGEKTGSFTRAILESASRLDLAEASQVMAAINMCSNIDVIGVTEHEAQQLNSGARLYPELDDEETAPL